MQHTSCTSHDLCRHHQGNVIALSDIVRKGLRAYDVRNLDTFTIEGQEFKGYFQHGLDWPLEVVMVFVSCPRDWGGPAGARTYRDVLAGRIRQREIEQRDVMFMGAGDADEHYFLVYRVRLRSLSLCDAYREAHEIEDQLHSGPADGSVQLGGSPKFADWDFDDFFR